jgi:hypothetical protein
MEPEEAGADVRTCAPGSPGESSTADSAPPWWARSPIRLGLLLTGLAAALLALFSSSGGLVDLRGGSSRASGAAFASGCSVRDAPEVARVPMGDLAALYDPVARIMPPRVGRVYEQGTVTTSNLWSDNQPQSLLSSPARSVPAGYEIRWWALDRVGNEDDVAADVFEFATHRQAHDVLVRAANTRCRRHGQVHPSRLPFGAENLSWVNPDNAEQWDLLFVRGRRLYRVGDVPARYPPATGSKQRRLKQLAVERTVAVLACGLPDAGCPAAAVSAYPPDLAGLAASSSTRPGSRRPVTRRQASTYAHAVNLRGYDVPGMTAVTREGTTDNLDDWGGVRCSRERSSPHDFVAGESPVFGYAGRLEGRFVYSTVTVFSSEAAAERYLAALASASVRTCVAHSYDRRSLGSNGKHDLLRVGRIAAAPLPAPTPASYRGVAPFQGTGLRLTIPISYTTRRGRRVQVDSYFEGLAFAYGRAVIGLVAESEFRPFAQANERYLMSKLVGRAEAYEADLRGLVD